MTTKLPVGTRVRIAANDFAETSEKTGVIETMPRGWFWFEASPNRHYYAIRFDHSGGLLPVEDTTFEVVS